jgi:leader peptidase (prepilin peptidase)/N-methyltransferase
MTPAAIIFVGILILLLIPIVAIDLRERRIPNALNAALAITGLVFQAATAGSYAALPRAVGAGAAIIVLFLGLIGLMRVLKRPGTLGFGDIKFLAAAGIWVGFIGSTVVFVAASLLALGFTLVRAPWRTPDLRAAIPFGPFLAISLAVVFVVSNAPAGRALPAAPAALD